MSLYLEQIRQLVALQHVDDGIHAVQAELEAAPKEVEELEKRFNRDRSYLSRLFKKAYGITIGEFIDRNREQYTATALARGMTQKEIAAQLGFSSASAFWLWRKRRENKTRSS